MCRRVRAPIQRGDCIVVDDNLSCLLSPYQIGGLDAEVKPTRSACSRLPMLWTVAGGVPIPPHITATTADVALIDASGDITQHTNLLAKTWLRQLHSKRAETS